MKLEIDSENICANCPGLRAMQERVDQIFDPENDLTVAEQAEGMNFVAAAADNLDRAAGVIACQNLEKELPDASVPVPLTGDPARIAFAAACPAYETYKRLQVAGNN
jgi:hypothetical protein